MKILRTRKELTDFAARCRAAGSSVALVPTMGALHAGHLSLMNRAVADNDVVIASVFVNPTQFNDKADLEAYPRTEQADFELLDKAGVTAVFAPDADEMYPPSEAGKPAHVFDLGEVAEVMEGMYRPGHFQGVAQIVSMLLRLVGPDRAYFGEKDFQQIAVIRRMTATEGINVEIIGWPICREADGLAMSSRNVRLDATQRATAPGIYRVLSESTEYSRTHTLDQTRAYVENAVNALPECRVEYFSIVDAETLREAADWECAPRIVGCITVYCGQVRLIDNITYRPIAK